MKYRLADGRNKRLPDLANELVGLQVSSILAVGPPASHAARAATATIPIVATSSDPVGEGLVASLARPGGNVTGLSYGSALLAGKNLQLLQEVSPMAGRVVALWYAPNVGSAFQLKELQDAAPRLGLHLQPVGVQDPDEFEAAFQSVARERADALFLIDGPEMFPRRMRILEVAGSARLPAMYSRREYVESGGLMAYGVSFPALWRRAAYYVERILKGAKPTDLPVEQPMIFEYVISLQTAQELGLTIPLRVLL